jgi:hypothetical protein
MDAVATVALLSPSPAHSVPILEIYLTISLPFPVAARSRRLHQRTREDRRGQAHDRDPAGDPLHADSQRGPATKYTTAALPRPLPPTKTLGELLLSRT